MYIGYTFILITNYWHLVVIMFVYKSSLPRPDPRLGHSCLHKSAACITVLRSMPGRVEANVTWLQVGLQSAAAGMSRASSPSFPIPWRVVDGGMKSTAMIHFRASTCYVTKQSKPTGTDCLGQRWTTCETPHFYIAYKCRVKIAKRALTCYMFHTAKCAVGLFIHRYNGVNVISWRQSVETRRSVSSTDRSRPIYDN